MIHAHRPMRFQNVHCIDENGNLTNECTTTINGCVLLFFDETRMSDIRSAVESQGLSIENFISQALETYCYSIEQSFANPQFQKLKPVIHEHRLRESPNQSEN